MCLPVCRQTVKVLLQQHQFGIVIFFFSPPKQASYASRLHVTEKLVERQAKLAQAKLAQAVRCRDAAKSVIDYLGASLTRGVGRTPEQRR